ncbi:hypothetical protein ACFW5I_13685 [Streptomyces sp. NPDC058818]|uniref:hypothetical protein n=1 Tax=Streptomyces sp. NPDC058818 TaxID=3346640 RepID=UPI00368C44F4
MRLLRGAGPAGSPSGTADLTVLAAVPLTVPATELADVPVLSTVLDGDPTHRAASL